ncbi:phosphatase 2C-like domain-containing protein [Lyophyllum atratum]|nr:phosphatase 2C-like domain-containing protein [Lyophyllum atratum]
MESHIITLPVATSSENLQALAEVANFGLTDMGYPGQGPWAYRILQEPSLTEDLARMSAATTYQFGVDVASLQPCPSDISRSQDRYVVEEWYLPDGKWVFNGVFDGMLGHLNHETVESVVRTLPGDIKQALHAALLDDASIHPSRVTDILRSSVQQTDTSITSQFLDLLPRDLDSLSCLKDSDIRLIFSREGKRNPNYEIAIRSLGGMTMALSLTDSRGNLWVVNLGVLGHRRQGGWSGSQITSVHDLSNPDELDRVTGEHPGEVEALQGGRVVGFLEPTRAIGDTWLKLPAIYASRVYSNLEQPWISSKKFKEYARRILTPPYVSNIPDIYHYVPDPPYFVLLTSDGLLSTDRYTGMETEDLISHWINIIGQALDSRSNIFSNAALCLLRDMIGGDNTDMASRNLTVEMEERWMDDTTILIQEVGCECI